MRVETYSGYKADEYPRRFWPDDAPREVIDIEDRWYGTDASYFKVFADDGRRYILRQEIKNGRWELTP